MGTKGRLRCDGLLVLRHPPHLAQPHVVVAGIALEAPEPDDQDYTVGGRRVHRVSNDLKQQASLSMWCAGVTCVCLKFSIWVKPAANAGSVPGV